ncbi:MULTISPECIES: cupin domain-containing protein [unclassified Ruegeria]|uniref:cupin domain-containing protein n=1 Tax=unclassified Ruegeria TaxID=2625375 RepID=UPI001487637A|nr:MULTISPECIES: cupin domain-containing protein [unclassified Ruegeria]NOD64839.1 cupin domain-containing protein [Ruegeria sp. HKCCD6109]NOD77645.1 cupin domain-containing protein [Ruegeria sp. HKCCD4332]NOD89851.1 cupin domain-containing protein [Ruegeria sp. HKCCD4318]NOE14703.1 cupin domain-containing protein [Ruegeria sp. HKCCD4318-2]NOG10943.1 cupin domain-containing protein [Ruegeria sp. HKCCD4315]
MARVTKSNSTSQTEAANANAGVGHEIRGVRRAMGMTLAECAEAASLSVGFLSLVERGQKQPSLDALQRISAALGIEVGWLFPPSPNDDPVENEYVVRKGFRRRIDFSRLAGTEYLDHSVYLMSPGIDGQIVMSLMQFSPGGHSGDNPLSHEGEEVGYVLSGQLTLEVDGHVFVLEEGDSFGFSGDKPHKYINNGENDLQIVHTNTPVIMKSR